MSKTWSDIHKNYTKQDWIDKPSLFAETAIGYFPKKGKVLDLGAGLGQDSRFFAEHGYKVICTDREKQALNISKSNLPEDLVKLVSFQQLDLNHELPFNADTFDIVYAHLSLHYFNTEISKRLFTEIHRILKPEGVLAFLVNSVNDPEYKSGNELEPDFLQIDKITKRYFSIATTREFTKDFSPLLLDEEGETYKDSAINVHNLVRFIGTKPQVSQLLSAKKLGVNQNNLEQWQLFSEQGNPIIGQGAEKNDIFEKGLLHGAAHVWIWRKNHGVVEILLQKRSSTKRTWPNLYDISAAGHIDFDEQPLSAALRETKEEIGINIDVSELSLFSVQRVHLIAPDGSIENEFQWLYITQLIENQTFNLQKIEVDSLEWIPLATFHSQLINKPNKYVPHGKIYYETVLLAITLAS